MKQKKFVRFMLALALFALASTAYAVTPAPDGGYSGANTAEGADALLQLTTGMNNTAVGFAALDNETTGSANTGLGYTALEISEATATTRRSVLPRS